MVVVDIGILWLFLSSALVVLMQAQAIRLATTNRELAASEVALRTRNAELDATNARLSEVDAMKNRFLAGIAQELRRPLNALLSEVKFLQRHQVQSPELLERLAHAIADEGEQLAHMIDALPERGNVDWHVLEPNESKVDPAEVLREAVGTIQSVAVCQHVNIDVDIPSTLSEVWANHERLVHSLVLLLDSAVTYSPRNSTVFASVATAGPEVVFRVRQDQGNLLPAMKIQEILASRRGEDLVGGEAKGGGFRLAMCRDIIESHRGRFWIDSTEKGTVFYVALPAVEYEPRTASYFSVAAGGRSSAP
jgi:signal transduction histidine kinase